ncbi:hypothetical protein HZC32_03315 [Candidatus Woesearchaeota archaeon]|nr:hypothetical protein [Candidatus Woesearchaeota archaeon]
MPAQNKLLISEVLQLREQGLTDSLIAEELKKKGYSVQQISMAISEADISSDESMDQARPSADFSGYPQSSGGFSASGYSGYGTQAGGMPVMPGQPGMPDDALYERIEETVETMIDEKWDELIAEVKKIIDWKEKIEQAQLKMRNELDKLTEDFQLLHQGVLGKLEDYDTRMRDVDTELKAVGRVFKEVVPEFVENVKELSSVTKSIKGRRGE